MNFVYTLDKSSKKFECPRCEKKRLVRYVDQNGNYADSKFGRCDRQDQCGYLMIPNDKQEGIEIVIEKIVKPISYIPFEDAEHTYKNYNENSFCIWLNEKLGTDGFNKALELYQFSIDQMTISNRDWVIFWQIDINMNCRRGKLVKYLADGHRDKMHSSTWFHF